MKAVTYSEARNNLASTLDAVCDDAEPVLITRRDRGNAVILAESEWRSLEETAYLMRSPKNAMRLIAAIEQLESGTGTTRDLPCID